VESRDSKYFQFFFWNREIFVHAYFYPYVLLRLSNQLDVLGSDTERKSENSDNHCLQVRAIDWSVSRSSRQTYWKN